MLGRILTLPPERGCVADQPQRLRKTGRLEFTSGFRVFQLLRLVLRAHSRAPAASQSGAVSRCARPRPAPMIAFAFKGQSVIL